MTTVYNFFPTRIWKTSNKDATDEFLSVIEKVKALDPIGRKVSNINGWQSHNINRLLPVDFYLDFFKDTILNEYGLEQPCNIEVVDVWANVSTFGGFNQIHDHISQSNFISFAHYLKLPNGRSTISFRSDRPSLKFFNAPVASLNDLNSQDVALDVSEGDIVFFPAWLDHYTTPNNTTADRISIAGNISIKYEKSTRS